MKFFHSRKTFLLAGSILLGTFACSPDNQTTNQNINQSPGIESKIDSEPIDLGPVLEKRIEGKTDEALKMLRNLLQKHPHSTEVLVQLGRILLEIKDFPLAAFRYEVKT